MLERPLLTEAIGRRIVSSGLLSLEEFEDLRRDALGDITTLASDVSSLIRSTKHDTLASGSLVSLAYSIGAMISRSIRADKELLEAPMSRL